MIRLALCQLRTELDWNETMDKAERMVRSAAESGADFAVLPEMFSCPYSHGYFRRALQMGHEETLSRMKAWAADNGIYLVGGSIPERNGDKLYNTCFVLDREGRQIACHRKVHLFDVDIPGMRFKESDNFNAGNEITVFDTEFGKMGAAICFDVRFPELFRAMAMRGARLIFLPAQFNTKTGPAHWESSIRARATDNQVFFAAASAARYEGFSYECWGHSTVADPYGTVIASCDEKEQILYADIDLNRVDEVRQQLPIISAMRRDVYTVSE